MLRIKIELIPPSGEPPTRTWTGEIWNDCTGTPAIADYLFRLYEMDSTENVWRGGSVKNFHRKHSVWYLLYLALHEVFK